MDFIKTNSETEWVNVALDLWRGCFDSVPCPRVTFPTGNTPLPFYAALRQSDEFKHREFEFIMLDEYAGQSAGDPRNFSRWLSKDLLDPLHVPYKNRLMFDPYAADIAAECVRFQNEFAQKGPLNMAFLGVGANGHLGMNDPPSAAETSVRVVEFSGETYDANKQYWAMEYPELPLLAAHGYTLGLSDIMAAEHVVLLLRGKDALLQKIRDTKKFDEQFPVSVLNNHNRVTILYT